jgi:hypothetical protein
MAEYAKQAFKFKYFPYVEGEGVEKKREEQKENLKSELESHYKNS